MKVDIEAFQIPENSVLFVRYGRRTKREAIHQIAEAISERLPPTVRAFLIPETFSVAQLDESDMNKAGWFRKPKD